MISPKLANTRIYVSDNGVVQCRAEHDCEFDQGFLVSGRRMTMSEYLTAWENHIVDVPETDKL